MVKVESKANLKPSEFHFNVQNFALTFFFLSFVCLCSYIVLVWPSDALHFHFGHFPFAVWPGHLFDFIDLVNPSFRRLAISTHTHTHTTLWASWHSLEGCSRPQSSVAALLESIWDFEQDEKKTKQINICIVWFSEFWQSPAFIHPNTIIAVSCTKSIAIHSQVTQLIVSLNPSGQDTRCSIVNNEWMQFNHSKCFASCFTHAHLSFDCRLCLFALILL